MTSKESIDDYKEVTPTERTTIETADKKWVEPSADLIRRAQAVGAVYNAATGFFELNGFTDIGNAEMEDIERHAWTWPCATALDYTNGGHIMRTTAERFSSSLAAYDQHPTLSNLIRSGVNLEVLLLTNSRYGVAPGKTCKYMMAGKYPKLREIRGIIVSNNQCDDEFKNIFGNLSDDSAPLLSEIRIKALRTGMYLEHLPALSLASLTYLVDEATLPTVAKTVTLHADAYARLTDELKTQAAAKSITFVTP